MLESVFGSHKLWKSFHGLDGLQLRMCGYEMCKYSFVHARGGLKYKYY